MDTLRLRVTGMPRAAIRDNGASIELEFEDSVGEPVTLVFASDHFDAWSSRAAQQVGAARLGQITRMGHLGLKPAEIAAATAQAPFGGGRVILALRDTSGATQQFAMTVAQSIKLRSDMATAEPRAASD